MVISVEHGIQKTFLVILSLIILALALYPFLLPTFPGIKVFEPIFADYLLIAVAIILLISLIKMKRPRVY